MATINLLVVVGLVGVQGSQLPGETPPNFITQYLMNILHLCTINTDAKHTGLNTKQQILGVGIKRLLRDYSLLTRYFTRYAYYSSPLMRPRTITLPTIWNGDAVY